MPQEQTILVLELCELALVEAVDFAGTFNAEDVFEAVFQAVASTRRLDEILGKFFVLLRFVVKWSHLLEFQILEAFIEQGDAAGVLGLAVRVHDRVGNSHVGECVQHGDFFAEQVVGVDNGGAGAAEDVGDRGVIFV